MVTFSKKKIQSSKISTRRNKYSRKLNKSKKTFLSFIVKFLLTFLVLGAFGVLIAGTTLYYKIIKPLPPVSKLKEMNIPQSSEIYDRNGKLLYSVFKEKRTYVDYDKISKNMINAIVAGEDKRFWTNPGFDLIGLIRAAGTSIIKGHKVGGTSTISQQLIKNTFLTNERSYERKIKEIYLSYKMTNKYDKKTIIEMYLNKISFGNNAYGIEQAAKTYFGKHAKDLNILESSILASIPKGPTLYSPYRFFYNKKRQRYEGYPMLMGYPYIYKKSLIDGIKTDSKKDALIEKEKIPLFPNTDTAKKYTKQLEALKKVIDNIKIKKLDQNGQISVCGLDKKNYKNIYNINSDNCSVMQYSDLLFLLNNIRVLVGDYYIEYQTGRKDFILQRMFEDGYLSKDNKKALEAYKEAFKKSFLFKFKKDKTRIKYPHFVFFVKKYLEERYGKTAIEEGGLKIYTTLDSNLQDKVEKIVKNHAKINKVKFGANNAAEITIDNKTGEIITMVGGVDYYNKEIAGENNIVTSRLQPGSTFKPFVYSLAMQKNKIGPKTPVFDVKTIFPGGYSPNNFDGKFMKKMTIASALNHSRNIPAIKMYYLAGKEAAIIEFMRKLGVESYYKFKKTNPDYNFGAPMVLGTGEMTPLELATAYSTIASLGNKKEITPILKIIDSNGNIIYNKLLDQKVKKSSILPQTAYLITSILTDTKARPAFWNKYLTIPGRKLAAKTGTSTKQYKNKWGKKVIFPQNLWTIGYTPQYTTVAWAGNTDGKKLYYKGNGLEGAGPIMQAVMKLIHKGKKVENWKRPKGIKEIVISKYSGKLPSSITPVKAKIKGFFINTPTEYDDVYFTKKVDELCNGKITDKTPPDAIKTITGIRYHSLKPNWPNWEKPVVALSSFGDIKISNEICERGIKDSNMQVGIDIKNNQKLIAGANFVRLAYNSINPIIKLEILLDNKLIASYKLPGKNKGLYNGAFNILSNLKGNHKLTVKAIDNNYYSVAITKTVILGAIDKNSPLIKLINPARGEINLKKDTNFNLRANFSDASPIRMINIYLNGKNIFSVSNKRKIVSPISVKGLEVGKYTLKIEAIDTSFNKSTKNVTINIIE